MSSDGERNFLPIVAIVIVVIFAFAITAGVVVWRRQQLADTEARATTSSSPLPPPPTSSAMVADPTAAPTAVDRQPPRGSANLGALDPTPIPNAEASVARLRPGFRSCYNKGLASDPSMAGSITIAIEIAANGDVIDVTKKSGSGLSSDVETCIMKRAKNASFDSPGSSGATLSVPVTFVQAR